MNQKASLSQQLWANTKFSWDPPPKRSIISILIACCIKLTKGRRDTSMTDALETESDGTQLGGVSPNSPGLIIRGKCRPLLRSRYTERTNDEVTAATPA